MTDAHDGTRRALVQDGRTGDMIPIILVNLLLTAATFGIYRFWAVARIRRFLWGTTLFEDEPLEYTGTGAEVFRAVLLAIVVIVLPLMLLGGAAAWAAETGNEAIAAALQAVNTILVLLLIPVAMYRARRYRLTRTTWRGIRAGQSGSALGYAWRWLATGLAVLLTLGLAWPWRTVVLQRYKLNHTLFGDSPLSFHGGAGPLVKPFLTAWVCALVALALPLVPLIASAAATDLGALDRQGQEALGIVAAAAFLPAFLIVAWCVLWYLAAEIRFLAANTRFDDLRFRSDLSAFALARLVLGNLAIVVLTLGALKPLTALRTIRLLVGTAAVTGEADFDAIAQAQPPSRAFGEGLADALDVG